ncbi:glycosyltransferase [Gracilibacillus massiliensis]|uniref:glycosyltransferase n=1 Tax=Gracilibacillus massiliensis TaxID=1564956 RepID=UPI00071C6012|nr:glycosyltransferase [Gracilibacillus massiliensis]
MNICIVNEQFNMGGAQRVAIELANTLQEKSNQVTLIDFSGKNNFHYKVNTNIEINKNISLRSIRRKIIGKLLNIKFTMSDIPVNTYDLYKEQIDQLIEELQKNKYDVVIMCQGILTSIIPLIKTVCPNQKIIAWQHNEFDIYINHYNKLFINDYVSGVKQSDLVICLTEADRNKFKKLNRNTCYIYNPLTIDSYDKNKSELNNKLILYVGRLNVKQKGLDYIIEIAKNTEKDWKILVAGDGKDRRKFIKMINDNDLKEKIILEGNLNTKELTELYLSSSVFISTSRWEGFGLVITEAMSFGLPIISFENNGPTEILKDGEYGVLVTKNNVAEFSKKLNDLINSLPKRKYYQNRSLVRVKEFKKEEIVKEWEYRLKKLVE